MFEEVGAAVAAALSAHGSELLVAGGKSALTSLYEIVRDRFGRRTPAAASLDAALQSPDTGNVEALARSLASFMAADPEFARRTLTAWQSVTTSGGAKGAQAVVNNFSGQAAQVIQARTINGGIRF
jgi:uncharacterized membrane protein YdbT with pleckstrin-like domain